VCYDRIAFSGRKGGEFDIYTIDLDGSGRRQLTFNSGSNEIPSWSPDGRKLISKGMGKVRVPSILHMKRVY
jgi:TolB protein